MWESLHSAADWGLFLAILQLLWVFLNKLEGTSESVQMMWGDTKKWYHEKYVEKMCMFLGGKMWQDLHVCLLWTTCFNRPCSSLQQFCRNTFSLFFPQLLTPVFVVWLREAVTLLPMFLEAVRVYFRFKKREKVSSVCLWYGFSMVCWAQTS